ncbi:MAG TPA: metallopeptidase family protein [Alphaproteobacteria bacterium]
MAQDIGRRIIMNFSTPPQGEDVHAVAISVIDAIPDDLEPFCEDMDLYVEEFPTRDIVDELDVESEFDLLAVYRSGEEKMPGVKAKSGGDARALTIYRRPILDLWCDTGEDLVALVRNVVISEIAQANGFSDEEIESMCASAAAASTM